MRLGKIEIIYIPKHQSAYDQARKELAKVTVKEVNTILVGATFITMSMLQQVYAEMNLDTFTDRVDEQGNKILTLIQFIGYWAALIFAAIDIVKAFKKQDIAGLIAIACKYAVAVGILYGLPTIFDIFKGLFAE
ncbi:MAG: hypothetical protein ACRDDX_10660 [Cellulosilyticaceae bacterium]